LCSKNAELEWYLEDSVLRHSNFYLFTTRSLCILKCRALCFASYFLAIDTRDRTRLNPIGFIDISLMSLLFHIHFLSMTSLIVKTTNLVHITFQLPKFIGRAWKTIWITKNKMLIYFYMQLVHQNDLSNQAILQTYDDWVVICNFQWRKKRLFLGAGLDFKFYQINPVKNPYFSGFLNAPQFFYWKWMIVNKLWFIAISIQCYSVSFINFYWRNIFINYAFILIEVFIIISVTPVNANLMIMHPIHLETCRPFLNFLVTSF